jgi:hypothetical protein
MNQEAMNGASGTSDIEGSEPDWHLTARVAASERGQRVSFKAEKQNPAFLNKSTSWIPGFLIVIPVFSALCIASRIFAGDAVAVGYNSEGIWTAVTYHCSSNPKGGRDYKDSKQAREAALRDLRRRAPEGLAKATILASSDLTGYVAVGRGKAESGAETNVVGYGKSQAEADKKAFAKLNEARATTDQKIVYRYFSHGADSK